jgi:hypothetical protein
VHASTYHIAVQHRAPLHLGGLASGLEWSGVALRRREGGHQRLEPFMSTLVKGRRHHHHHHGQVHLPCESKLARCVGEIKCGSGRPAFFVASDATPPPSYVYPTLTPHGRGRFRSIMSEHPHIFPSPTNWLHVVIFRVFPYSI